MAFTLQIRQNHVLQTIALLRSLMAYASANICYALTAAQSIKFCLIHPKQTARKDTRLLESRTKKKRISK